MHPVGKIKTVFWVVGLMLLGLNRCTTEEDVLVCVYDKTLTATELAEMTPAFETQSDSLVVLPEYINAWVLRQVMIHEAEKNLSREEKKFDREIEDYRNSLLIHVYQNKIVEQRLKKEVSDKEIEMYYNQNKEKFRLMQPIIKINYVKLPLKSQHIQSIKQMLFSNNQDQAGVENLCHEYAVNYYLSNDWLLFDDIIKEVPIQDFSEDDFKKNKVKLEFNDKTYSYLVWVKNFQLSEGTAPLNIKKNEIIDLILQERRMKLLEELKAENLQKAQKEGQIVY